MLRPLAIALFALALAFACLAQPPEQDPNPLLEAYQRAERCASGEFARLVGRSRVEPHWIDDTHRFWYRNDARGTREFVLVDADAGARQPAFDHARLADALSEASGETVRADQLPFGEIEFSADLASVRFVVDWDAWECDLATYACRRVEPTKPDPDSDVRPPDEPPAAPERGREPGPPGRSPDGAWDVTERDLDLWLRPVGGGDEVRLTDDGAPGGRYSLLQWAPDSKRIVAIKTAPGEHAEMHMMESVPAEGFRPVVRSHPYDLPGDRLDSHEMWLVDVEKREPVRVDAEPVDWWGPPDPHWLSDGRHFLYKQVHRGFQRTRVIEVDAWTGATRTVIDEKPDTFVAIGKEYLRYLDATGEILWASERNGWNHLYLYDVATGEMKNQVTQGEWVVRGVESVDEQARTVHFTASGREHGESPYHIHHYRVNLDGTGLTRLTDGPGSHDLGFSPDGAYYLDRYSRVDLAPVTTLRRSSDGSLVCELEKAETDDLVAAGWPWPEPFHAKGRDGVTDIWGVIFRPSNLDASRKHPVIENIYAGPQDTMIPVGFSAAHGSQAMAELGFIVVQIDGMGMSGRSKAFHDVCWRNLGDSGFPDRILWMQAAAERYPYIDLTRVGITGTSAGGYNAAHALIARPDFYKVAVAISGNHDHRTDKTWWNEQWMGYPVGEHYAEQSNIEHAADLRGKLLLIHGELDDNVNAYASTMRFVDALIKANKDFDLLIEPGMGHGTGIYGTRRTWDYFVRNLQGVEPPLEYDLSRGDAGCTFTIRNLRQQPVEVFWKSGDSFRKYHDLAPGQEIAQHSYLGHEWVARAGGKVVSRYTVDASALEWGIL